MLYDVEQVAIKLNVSKMTIYNKIKLKEFKDKVVKKAGKTFIDEDLLNLIKESLKSKGEVETDKEETQVKQEIAADTVEFINFNKDYIASLKQQIELLMKEKEELKKEKDKDIEYFKEQAGKKDYLMQMQNETFKQELQEKNKLMENMQVLLKNEQEKPNDILLLEEHFKQVDEKLSEFKEQMEQKKENKGFFSKFFKGE